MFLQWCGEVQAISFYLRSTFGFVGKDAASEAHQFRNTNVVANWVGSVDNEKLTSKNYILTQTHWTGNYLVRYFGLSLCCLVLITYIEELKIDSS